MVTGRTLSARVGTLLLTLWLVSILVFFAGQVLPGNVGRIMLGPFADAQAVAELNAAGRRPARSRPYGVPNARSL